jgi:hypothetical protein
MAHLFAGGDHGPDRARLVRYLLGLVPEEEAVWLDEASIADDAVAAALGCVENDLVDAYLTGTLDGPTRARFEAYYLRSPRRRERVHRAAGFLAGVDRAAARRRVPGRPGSPTRISRRRPAGAPPFGAPGSR